MLYTKCKSSDVRVAGVVRQWNALHCWAVASLPSGAHLLFSFLLPALRARGCPLSYNARTC